MAGAGTVRSRQFDRGTVLPQAMGYRCEIPDTLQTKGMGLLSCCLRWYRRKDAIRVDQVLLVTPFISFARTNLELLDSHLDLVKALSKK